MRSKVFIGMMLLATACLETEVPPSEYDQLVKEMAAIDSYLAANPSGPNDLVVKDASGVRLVITTQGTGAIPPNAANTIKVSYAGRLLSNGTLFDSNDGYVLKLSSNVIDGWKLGIPLLTKGSTAKLYIPSILAYGTSGSGSIPPKANLVFDIGLLEITPTAQQLSSLAADTVAIDNYLASNSIAAQKHNSGIRYVMTQTGTGAMPSLYDEVKVKLKVKLMTTGEVIVDQVVEPNISFSSKVINYPHGALVGLQLMAEGGKATFYVPNLLANNMSAVPANTNVIFEVELLDVINK